MDETIMSHIVSKPGVCGGQPCIGETRIRVQDIYVWHELQGKSADQIVSDFPQVSMADVYAALSYYWDHRDEMRRLMEAESAFVESVKQKNPSLLQMRLAGKDGKNDPLSSG